MTWYFIAKTLIDWQLCHVFEATDFVRYPDGSSCGTRSITDLITTLPVADIDQKKTINLDSSKKFAEF